SAPLQRRGPVGEGEPAGGRVAAEGLVPGRIKREPVGGADGSAADGAEAYRDDLGGGRHLGKAHEQLVGLGLAGRVHVLPDVEAVAADRRDRAAGAAHPHTPLHRRRASPSPPAFSTTPPLSPPTTPSPPPPTPL